MTSQQNRSNYICIILISILEVFTIIGAYSANYFTRTRMGMLRHVVYLNGKWEKAFAIPMIKWISITIIIVFVIFIFLRFYKEKVNLKIKMMIALLTIGISGGTVYFLLVYNTEKDRAYYILSICYILITVFQNILYHCILSIKSRD